VLHRCRQPHLLCATHHGVFLIVHGPRYAPPLRSKYYYLIRSRFRPNPSRSLFLSIQHHRVWFGIDEKRDYLESGDWLKDTYMKRSMDTTGSIAEIKSKERVFTFEMGISTNGNGPMRIGQTNGECLPLPL
jgi:hypothetical protein